MKQPSINTLNTTIKMGKNSKSKLLKKGKYTPEAVKATAPANPEAEKKQTIVKNAKNARIFVKGRAITIDDAIKKKKERDDRTRMRRFNRMVAAGMTEEQIKEFENNLQIRTIMLIPYANYFFIDGKKTKTVTKRDEKHHPIGKETVEVDNRLTGVSAVLAFLKSQNIEPICGNTVGGKGNKPLGYVYFNTTADELEKTKELVKDVGRIVIHKWVPEEPEEERKQRKPSNNTKEAKAAAKKARKDANKEKAAMRPYYAALRKGGVSKRIKKYNKPLAEKIEKWIKERRAAEAEKAEKSKEYRAQHRQLTSLEMKANKRARKAAKHLATQERRREREMKAMANNQAAHEKRAQEAAKHGKKAVQQKLDMPKEELKKAA